MTQFHTLVDVATAPNGMVLERGIWFTHDLDMTVLGNVVAPALTAQDSADPALRRRRAAAALVGNEIGRRLFVVADGRRLHPGPAVPWASVVPVHGRVQHAKFGVLLFRSDSSSAYRLRAFVASANLTRAGCSANLELLLVEERSSKPTSGTLAGDLVAAASAFVRGAGDDEVRASDSSELSSALAALRDVAGAPAGRVRHSLDAPRDLLPPPRSGAGAAGRVDVVSPAFAAPGDATVVSKLLVAHLGPSTEVVWHLDAEPDGSVRVPRAAWRELQGRTQAEVSVVGDGDRRLHAKLIAITRGGAVDVVAGSANFTRRGLGGRNRELVVHWVVDDDKFDLIEQLGSQPVEGPLRYTDRHVEAPSNERVRVPDVVAVFRYPDETGTLWGQLEFDGVAQGSTVEVKIDGRWNLIQGGRSKDMPLGAAAVAVRITNRGGATRTLLVPVDYSSVPPSAWAADDYEDNEVDHVLADFLRAFRRRQESRAPTTSSTPGVSVQSSKDDKYLQHLAQPLVLLCRYRHQLVEQMSVEDRQQMLDDLSSSGLGQWDPVAEGPIAAALLGLASSGRTRLLRSLHEVVS